LPEGQPGPAARGGRATQGCRFGGFSDPTNYQQALTWFSTEHPVLVAVVDYAAATGLDTHTWQLASSLGIYLDRRGHWHDLMATARSAVAAATRLADLTAQGDAHELVARAYAGLGLHSDSLIHLRHA
jgi:hypothetical protein